MSRRTRSSSSRCRIVSADGRHAEARRAMRQLLAERDGSRCFYCLEPVEDPTRLTFDHFAPACFLPVAESWNLVLSCCACNQAKASLLPRGLVLVLLAITFPDGEAMRSGETPADLREFPVREAA